MESQIPVESNPQPPRSKVQVVANARFCINSICTIRLSCERFKEFIELTPEERGDVPGTLGQCAHYWQEEDGQCFHWVLRDILNMAGKGQQIKTFRTFQPRTKRHRRRGGDWG